jgi:long-chain acyl-CoA synthetase
MPTNTFEPADLIEAETKGMATSFWARLKPDAAAAYDRFGSRTFGEVNANANRIVRLLRAHGVEAGEHIAFVVSNRIEVMEIMAANLRGGYRLVPVNWHLTTEEVAYILADCDARAVFVEARFTEALEAARRTSGLKVKIAIDGAPEGFVSLEQALKTLDGSDINDPQLGTTMFYTSGTTGRPKGVFRPNLNLVAGEALNRYDHVTDVQLCVCPTYHGSGLTIDTRTAMTGGVPVVYQDRWDSLQVLNLIQERRVTHTHLVPIMFQRLLAVAQAQRDAFDVSSLKFVMHGAAPCPPDVKRAMIDWAGPILYEYYAGTEGGAGFAMDSLEWLEKPGSVGKRPVGSRVRILDEDGQDAPPGVPGMLYFARVGANGFTYYKDPAKTQAAHRGEFYTLGDIGYFDEEDYLFLTGRTADCIISGGVNIYPQEIDNEILKHPAVEDVGTVGVPNREWGEEIKAVVTLRPGYAPNEALADEIKALVRSNLAGFKVPRSVEFVSELPRNAAGKIERNKVRAPYWAGRKVQI